MSSVAMAQAPPQLKAVPSTAGPQRQSNATRATEVLGNQARLRELSRTTPDLHTGLEVGATPTQLSRKCAECEVEATQTLRGKSTGSPERNGKTAPSIVHDVLRGEGQPLDPAIRAAFEPRFRHDFGLVRVHSDARAAESARHVHALAYTVGRDIVFAAGRYSPETKAGRSLLAHELAHVIQQRNAPSKAALLQSKLPIGDADDRFERQAEAAAERFASLDGRLAGNAPPAVQRQADHTDEEPGAGTTAQAAPASGSIEITEPLFEEDPGNPGQLQASPDPAMGPLLQRQPDIPPPPPAYPSSYQWYSDLAGQDPTFSSLFGLTCTDGRERGFYVMWNESTNKSYAGPVEIGDPAKGCASAHINFGPVPPDRKSIYPVGMFHTHPLANPGCRKIEVGPSKLDKDTAASTGLPGLVIDTKTPTASCKDSGYFFFGPTTRR
jgi:hypothetical protein